MKPGEKCILMVGGKRHLGAVLSWLPSKPVFEHGIQVAEAPASLTISVERLVILGEGSDDLIIEMDGTEHPISIDGSETIDESTGSPRTVIRARLKPQVEVPTAQVGTRS